MAQTLFTKPWIHVNAVSRQGERMESWLSFSRNVAGSRGDHLTSFDDFRTGMRFEYSRRSNELQRLSVRAWEADLIPSMAGVLDAILRGDDSLGQPFADLEFVKQRKRTLDEHGQRWIEYELEFHGGDLTNMANRGVAVIRVDPDQMLPTSLTVNVASETLEYAFDYPDEGPTDIYALGVPRDVPVENCLPPPDLEQILKAVERGRKDLDDYSAVVFQAPQFYSGKLVWRKGDKWRVDLCTWKGPPSEIIHIEPIGPAFDLGSWWQQRKGEFVTYPHSVCNGSSIYRYETEGAKGKPTPAAWKRKKRVAPREAHAAVQFGEVRDSLIELRAYPMNLSTELGSWPSVSAHLDHNGENGPAGSVRIELLHQDGRGRQRQEFWLDPTRGYVLLKEEATDLPRAGDDPSKASGRSHGIHEFEGLRQSPRGVWYPTVVRWSPAGSPQTYYYHLDFNVEVSDDLFTVAPPTT